MIAHRADLTSPNAYWDRADNLVRDWKTGRDLPHYEGVCLVYRDVEGPTMVKTFLANGERQWERLE
jgi:hypothetical protein